MDVDELPPDPDLDDLPAEIAEHPGPLYHGWRDPDTDEIIVHREVTKSEIAATLADQRRATE
jgi:hypothetical protein